MKIFLGWSGERSKAMASALHDWLPIVLHYVQPWMSENDIAAGERWSQELATQLGESNFGIISVTQDNLSEPWILFEAGSLAKSLDDGRVTPLLLDLEISDVGGPLAQFQSKKAGHDGAWDIVCGINKCPTASIEDGRLKQLFEMAWPTLEERLAAIPAPSNAKPRRSQLEILEELVTSVRSFDSRLSQIEEVVVESLHSKFRKGRRQFHPMMLEEIQMMVGDGPRDPVGLLALGSMFRDEFPPLAELCSEVYRAYSSGRPKEGAAAVERLRRMTDYLAHGRMRDEFSSSKEMHMLVRELPMLIDMLASRLSDGPGGSGKRKEPG